MSLHRANTDCRRTFAPRIHTRQCGAAVLARVAAVQRAVQPIQRRDYASNRGRAIATGAMIDVCAYRRRTALSSGTTAGQPADRPAAPPDNEISGFTRPNPFGFQATAALHRRNCVRILSSAAAQRQLSGSSVGPARDSFETHKLKYSRH